jgi:MFS transporter, FSR family, fosmidomycin resistance protein
MSAHGPESQADARVDRRGITVLAAGHACVDTCQGAVPALVPFIVLDRGVSVAAAAALLLASNAASTLVQPLFGAYSDRLAAAWLLPASVACAIVGIALAGVVPGYPLIFAAVLLSGIGIAAYHPEGSRYANYVSGASKATGMSYYALGGNIGFALGPLLVTPLVLLFGLPGTAFLLIPGAVVAALVSRTLPHLNRFHPEHRADPAEGGAPDDGWRAFIQLIAVICCRSIGYFSLLALLPLYFINVLGTSEAAGNTALTGMLAAGALGTLVGGRLADRIGRRTVLIASLAIPAPLIVLLTTAEVLPAALLAAGIGLFTVSSFSVTVVMGQEYLPHRIGLASGFTLGAAIGSGGLAAPLFGVIADAHGLQTAIELAAIAPAVGALLAISLPVPATARLSMERARAARAAG